MVDAICMQRLQALHKSKQNISVNVILIALSASKILGETHLREGVIQQDVERIVSLIDFICDL